MTSFNTDNGKVSFVANVTTDDNAAHMDIHVMHRAGADMYRYSFDTQSVTVEFENINGSGPEINYSFIPNYTVFPNEDHVINLFVNIVNKNSTQVVVFQYKLVGGDTWKLFSINGDSDLSDEDEEETSHWSDNLN